VKKSELNFTEEKDLGTGPSVTSDLLPRPTGAGTDLKSEKGLYSGPSPIHNLLLYAGVK